MNVKTVAALVGTLSLSTLAAGCATGKQTSGPAATSEKGKDYACHIESASAAGAEGTPVKAAEASCGAQPASTDGNASEHKCGAGKCGSGSCGGAQDE